MLAPISCHLTSVVSLVTVSQQRGLATFFRQVVSDKAERLCLADRGTLSAHSCTVHPARQNTQKLLAVAAFTQASPQSCEAGQRHAAFTYSMPSLRSPRPAAWIHRVLYYSSTMYLFNFERSTIDLTDFRRLPGTRAAIQLRAKLPQC